MILIYDKHPPFACIYTKIFAFIRESFALQRERLALIRESNAFIRESYSCIRESFALIREKYIFPPTKLSWMGFRKSAHNASNKRT